MTRLLLVDDEDDIRLLARIILEGAGYDVVDAPSGERALELIDAMRVDLVLLDIRMAGMDGWEVMAAIAQRPDDGRPRVLACSAYVAPKVLDRSLELGCVEVLVKPFTPDECLAAVRRALA